MTTVRVRGIYATGVTKLLLEEGHEVVDVSEAIDERFGADFGDARPEVSVETTYDRQGMRLSGDGARDLADELAQVGEDVFVWEDDLCEGSVYNAEVETTLGRGAVVDLPGGEGFLPYSNSDERIEEGDRLRLSVVGSEPPWSDRKPAVSPGVALEGDLLSMVRDGSTEYEGLTRREANEVSRTAETVSASPPDGWGVRWKPEAAEAGIAEIGDEIRRYAETAEEIESSVSEAPKPENGAPLSVYASDSETVWVWLGRDARFGLDTVRHEVVPTTEGHHRIKAGSREASAAVDFFEAVNGRLEEFPFEGVVESFGPSEGDKVSVVHGKPDGRRIELGEAEVIEVETEDREVVVERGMTGGGTYDALGVEKEEGDVAVTYFREGNRSYATVYRDENGDEKGTYVNISTPVEVFPDEVRYVDLHVDVVRHRDGETERVDEDLLWESVEEGHVSEELAEDAVEVAENVEEKIKDAEDLTS